MCPGCRGLLSALGFACCGEGRGLGGKDQRKYGRGESDTPPSRRVVDPTRFLWSPQVRRRSLRKIRVWVISDFPHGGGSRELLYRRWRSRLQTVPAPPLVVHGFVFAGFCGIGKSSGGSGLPNFGPRGLKAPVRGGAFGLLAGGVAAPLGPRTNDGIQTSPHPQCHAKEENNMHMYVLCSWPFAGCHGWHQWMTSWMSSSRIGSIRSDGANWPRERSRKPDWSYQSGAGSMAWLPTDACSICTWPLPEQVRAAECIYAIMHP